MNRRNIREFLGRITLRHISASSTTSACFMNSFGDDGDKMRIVCDLVTGSSLNRRHEKLVVLRRRARECALLA